MAHCSGSWFLSLLILLLGLSVQTSQSRITIENGVKSSVFLSPKFVLEPGSVANKYYYGIDFPRGHIAIKSFNAEVVDEAGNPIPLHETYLHHWLAMRYYQPKSVEIPKYNDGLGCKLFNQSDFNFSRNAGLCDCDGPTQYFGLGSETRRTATYVPDPYGIEVGNPAEIPAGYEEKWLMNVHAIDTRGVEDRLGCAECWCDLYNVTEDENGRPLKPGFTGGAICCYDQAQCRVREGFESPKRGLYMRYTVKWVDWNNFIVPVKIYIFDVTDTWKKLDDGVIGHNCPVEYDVDACTATDEANDGCIDTKRVSLSMPTGGNVIYSVAHQHAGGIGLTLYGEDGRVICHSTPTYGEGKEAGNEAGYIVGMSTCYPQPGSVKISDGETLVLESNYSSAKRHTGVMGLFYVLVADKVPQPNPFLPALVEEHEKMTLPRSVWGIAFFGAAIAVAAAVAFRRKSEREEGYQSI
ncbi:uncharacterized protein LOC132281101 [Cornus florida]|uniref:uncharacterized protein LOC132281101 n=1 Tax=Cornus florida TaxID=4283 RepID=UPI0028976703|nr:uncharacterized protein LOC132281101 [Cornus florida]